MHGSRQLTRFGRGNRAQHRHIYRGGAAFTGLNRKLDEIAWLWRPAVAQTTAMDVDVRLALADDEAVLFAAVVPLHQPPFAACCRCELAAARAEAGLRAASLLLFLRPDKGDAAARAVADFILGRCLRHDRSFPMPRPIRSSSTMIHLCHELREFGRMRTNLRVQFVDIRVIRDMKARMAERYHHPFRQGNRTTI